MSDKSPLIRVHAYMGLLLLLPLCIWTITGAVFLLQPGYKDAFEQLTVKTHPINKAFELPSSAAWQEARYIRTILGWHLLVRDENGLPQHLHPQTYEPWPWPESEMIAILLSDSIAHNSERYGQITAVEKQAQTYSATTSAGVEMTLDWLTLELRQTGSDSRFINRLYRLHYLQLTPNPTLNRVLALAVLTLLLAMCFVSLRMLITHKWE